MMVVSWQMIFRNDTVTWVAHPVSWLKMMINGI